MTAVPKEFQHLLPPELKGKSLEEIYKLRPDLFGVNITSEWGPSTNIRINGEPVDPNEFNNNQLKPQTRTYTFAPDGSGGLKQQPNTEPQPNKSIKDKNLNYAPQQDISKQWTNEPQVESQASSKDWQYMRLRTQDGAEGLYRVYPQGGPDPELVQDLSELTNQKVFKYLTQEEKDAARRQYDYELAQRGPDAQLRKDYVDTMPFLSQVALGANREGAALGYGVKQAATIGKMLFHNALGDTEDLLATYKKYKQAETDRAAQNEYYKEFDENSGAGGAVGRMLPYILTERLIGPVANKVAGKVTSGLDKVFKTATEEGRSFLKAGGTAIDQPGVPLIESLKTLPKRTVSNFYVPGGPEPVVPANPFYKGVLNDFVGSSVVGAIEGAIHPDMSALEGMSNSMTGTAVGNVLRPRIVKHPILWDPPMQELISRYKKATGLKRLTPGLETGNPLMQKHEHALLNDQEFAVTTANTNKRFDIGDANLIRGILGMPRSDSAAFSKPELQAQMRGLKTELNDFDANARAILDRQAIRNIADAGKQAETAISNQQVGNRSTASADQRRALSLADHYRVRILKNSSQYVDPTTGKFLRRELPGTEFQKIYRELKANLDKAYEKQKPAVYTTLQPIKDTLDSALDRGAAVYAPDKNPNYYRDLRERYELSTRFTSHWLKPSGAIDYPAMVKDLKNKELQRIVTDADASGRRKDLFDLAGLFAIRKDTAGSDLSGVAMSDWAKQRKVTQVGKYLGGWGSWGYLSPLKEIMARGYLNDYMPTGQVFGMSGKNFGNPNMYTRALAMSLNPHPGATVIEGGKWTVNKLNSVKDWLERYM